MDQDVPQLVQAEPIKKSNSFEKEASEIDAKIDIGEMELFEETIVSDGNDTDSSFGDIGSENEVKFPFKVWFRCLVKAADFSIRILTANIFESGPMPTPWKYLDSLPVIPSC